MTKNVSSQRRAEVDLPPADSPRRVLRGYARVHERRREIRPIHVSAVEMEWLRWLCRHRYANFTQLRRRFGRVSSVTREHCYRLRDVGLLAPMPTIAGCQSVWIPTTAGHRLVGYETLGDPYFNLGGVPHQVIATNLATDQERMGRLVLTERELRAAVHHDAPTYNVEIARHVTGQETGPLFIPRLGSVIDGAMHYPDFVVVFDPTKRGARTVQRAIAFEVELTPKPPKRWKEILAGYARMRAAGHLGGVRYDVATQAMANRIRRFADQFPELSTKVLFINVIDPDVHGVPIPGRVDRYSQHQNAFVTTWA